METLINFLTSNINFYLLFLIVLGGVFITKFSDGVKIEKSYKVLIASVTLSIIFYLIDGCGINCIKTYLFTYLFATSFYELILKKLLQALNIISNKDISESKSDYLSGDSDIQSSSRYDDLGGGTNGTVKPNN